MTVCGKTPDLHLLSLKSSPFINSLSLMNYHLPITQLQQASTFSQSYFTCCVPTVCVHMSPSVSWRVATQVPDVISLHSRRLQGLSPGFPQCTILSSAPKDLRVFRRGEDRSHKCDDFPARPRRKVGTKLKSQSSSSTARKPSSQDRSSSFRLGLFSLVRQNSNKLSVT